MVALLLLHAMKWMLHLQLLLLPAAVAAQSDWTTPYERYGGTQTATYQEAISYYQRLAAQYNEIKVLEYGSTDVGKPLHLVVVSKDGISSGEEAAASGRVVMLVNNGIHPGEPVGIDASMLLARDLVQNPEMKPLLERVVVAIIPVFNVGGALNRNGYSRANQQGPEAYGFRGNARNLDLNRDFMKMDSRSARTFAQIFHEWEPHLFTDNHTTNGADYQHVMTLISTQYNKLHPLLAQYLEDELEPLLYKQMEKAGFPMTPYVMKKGKVPEEGLVGFLETPRYSTGYTALFNCIGFVPETHMLKPYNQRVEASYALMELMLQAANRDWQQIIRLRKAANEAVEEQQEFALQWELDTTQTRPIMFLGYEAEEVKSQVGGLPLRVYNQERPFSKEIDFYPYYKAVETAKKPVAYVIPQAWPEVIERLALNEVEMKRLTRDTVLELTTYYIEGYKTLDWPYEGHYLHHNVETREERQPVQLFAGDYLVYCNQPKNRYIVQSLEPEGVDAFFAWNFFDEILMRKEYFSPYVFDSTAARLLQQLPEVKAAYEERLAADEDFRQSHRQQLQFIYERSPYFEKTYLRYPVFRMEEEMVLPVE